MPVTQKANIAASLGKQFQVEIDKQWPFRREWAKLNPIGDKLAFTFPDFEQGFSEAADVNYADNVIVGRAESYKTYVGTGNRTFTVTIKFQAQGLQSAISADAASSSARDGVSPARQRQTNANFSATAITDTLMAEVVNPAMWLESLKYPFIEQDSELSHAPPPIYVTVGELFQGRCLLTDANVQWQPPFDVDSLLPFAAEVPCTFTVVQTSLDNFWKSPRRFQ